MEQQLKQIRPPLINGLYHKQVYGRTVFVDGKPYLLPDGLRDSGHVYILVQGSDIYLSSLLGTPILKLDRTSGLMRAAL